MSGPPCYKPANLVKSWMISMWVTMFKFCIGLIFICIQHSWELFCISIYKLFPKSIVYHLPSYVMAALGNSTKWSSLAYFPTKTNNLQLEILHQQASEGLKGQLLDLVKIFKPTNWHFFLKRPILPYVHQWKYFMFWQRWRRSHIFIIAGMIHSL